MSLAVFVYLALCLFVARMSLRTNLGFWRTFLFSIMLTPMVMIFYLLIFVAAEIGKPAKGSPPSKLLD